MVPIFLSSPKWQLNGSRLFPPASTCVARHSGEPLTTTVRRQGSCATTTWGSDARGAIFVVPVGAVRVGIGPDGAAAMAVPFCPDQLMVQTLGAPPILVTLEEAGLRVGTESVVSEGTRYTTPRQDSAGSSSGYQLRGGGRCRRWLAPQVDGEFAIITSLCLPPVFTPTP